MDNASLLSQRVYTQIREGIAAGSLPPGKRMRETELAEQLNVSRTPIREALRLLEANGLLAHAPHEGLVVAKLDHQSVVELYAMREVLEGTAARFAARHASDVELQELETIVEMEGQPSLTGEQLARLNKSFHVALYHAGHNRYLVRALHSLGDAMALLGGTTLAEPHRSQHAREEHKEIIASIASRDPDVAEETTRKHIRNAQLARLKLMRQKRLSDEID